MAYRCFWALFWCMILFLHKTLVYGTTHWLVTEDGRIQGQMDSIYNLQRPYDLMALLKQEQRAIMLENLKQELLAKKNDIDSNDEKDNGLEQKFYRTDPNCIAAGQPLIEFDLYMSTVLPLENKGIRPDDYVDFSVVPHPPFSPPDCTQHVPLDFSMHALEHLEGMKDRKNLTMSPEVGLKNAISHGDNIDKYGHLLNEALQQNETSWVLYNMAAFYWRIKGSPYQAMECLRRALHYSPRRHKDVALISLGNVLHHARYSNEAAIVVHAALDVSKELNVNHFTLGNIYAVLAEYNRSVICFENTLKIQPDFEAAAKRRHAVLCHSKLETMLESKHRSLQRTLTELREYQQKHELWHQQQQKLISEQARLEEKIEQRLFYDAHRVNSADKEVGELCSMEEKDGRNMLQCAWARVRRVLSDYDFTPWGSTDAIVMASEKTDVQDVDYSQPVRPPLYRRNDRSTLPEDQESLPYLSEDWPTKDECDLHVQKFPTWNEFPTTYLSPENKGFDVKTLLGKAQGLQPGEQHPFPWYPPVCSSLSDIPEGAQSYDHLASIKDRGKLNAKIADPSMKAALLSSVEGLDGKDAATEAPSAESSVKLEEEKIVTDEPILNRQVTQDETGQRILTALKQKIGPSWILYNLAGLYWRIVGNNLHGLDCIRRALYFVPDQYRDVPLLNLANVLYKLGRVDDAVTVMKDALTVNGLEPESQFFMGNLLAAVGNLTGAVHHYQMALAQDRLHGAAHSSLRLILCYQKFHRKAQSSVPKDIPPSPCPDGKTTFTSGADEPHVICTQDKKNDPYNLLDRYPERLPGQNRAQLCSITPIIVETSCGIPSHLSRDQLHCSGSGNKGPLSLDITKMKALSSEHCNGQLLMGPLSDTLGGPSQFTDFNSQLEDITEYYRQKGICSGSDCDRLLFQTAQHHKPHMRLEVIDGILHHRLIFTETPVSPSDCVIYNDGHYSAGCNRDDLKAFIDNVEHCEKLQVHDTDSSIHKQSFSCGNSEDTVKASPTDKTKFPRSDRGADAPTETFVPIELPNDYFRTDFFNTLDPTRFISKTLKLPVPNIKECQKQSSPRSVDFQELFSSWVSVTTKLKDFSNHIDFSIKPSPSKNSQPLCSASLVDGSTVLRRIRSLQMMNTLKDHYGPESGLTETLQTMGGLSTVSESIPVIGARLSHALRQNSTSWVINNLAALFWRVTGHVDKAVDCVLVAYHFSKEDDKAIALLSLTNILQKCGELDDAILVTKMALEKAPSIVAAHFMMANLYAAKGDLGKAQMFYESTLGLQQSFSPARERLHAIQCQQLTKANPERPDDQA